MKALVKREANIISIPDDFAILERITQDGYFVYKIKYNVDPVKVVRAKTLKTIISVLERPNVRRQVKTFTNFNPVAIHKRLRLRRAITKDLIRQEKSAKIFSFVSDISKHIPNNRTVSLSKARFTSPPILSTKLRIRPALTETIRNQNLSLPILDRNLSRLPSSLEGAPRPNFRKLSSRLLVDSKVDPAALAGNKSNTISSATKAIDGTLIKNATTSLARSTTKGISLVSTLLNRRNYSNLTQLKNSAYFNIPVKEEFNWIEVEETLRIPIGNLPEDEFFLSFELRNVKDLDVQTIGAAVPHGENITRLQIPTEAPEIVAFPVGALGRNVLNVKQIDESANKIQIYRKEINKSVPNIDAQYDFVGEVDAEVGEGFVKVEDLFASSNPVIYRAIPVNGNEILGADFSSVVVEQKKRPFARGKYFRKPYFVSLTSEIREKSIAVTARDIVPGPIAIRLLRRDLTIKQKNFSIVTSGAEDSGTTLLEEGSNTPIVIEDPNVKENRIYEYKLLLIFPEGDQEEAANNLIVEFTPIVSNILDLQLGEPDVQQSGDDIDVTFEINKNVIETEGDLIKSFLTEQGLTAEFQDQLLASRDQLQNLFGVKVTRRNLTTGELEDFGIVSTAQFSDQQFGRVRSVKPLQPGFDYEYNVTAHARETETLFSSLRKVVTPRTNVSYSFSPNKWRHPITLRQGNLVSDRTLRRNHARTTFTFGTVVDNRSVTVSLAEFLPSLYAGKVSRFGENQTFVQWKVQGDVNKIDHFIVILEVLGMRTVVGKSHNVSNSNYFQFVDKLTNKESGELTYFIVPVFFDYSRGPELKTNSVII